MRRQQQIRRQGSRRVIRATHEWRSYVVISLIVLIVFLVGHVLLTSFRSTVYNLPLLLIVPFAILAFGCYRAFFPSEWSVDDEPDRAGSLFSESETALDTPSPELKGTLGPMADDLHEVEKRLLDSMASARVAGPGLIATTKELSATRSDLIGGASATPTGRNRKRGKPPEPHKSR